MKNFIKTFIVWAELSFTQLAVAREALLAATKRTSSDEITSATKSGRIQYAWLSQLIKTLLIFLLGVSMTAYANTDSISWHEEVKLLDGRVIIIETKFGFPQGYDKSTRRGVFREAWITLKLPETGNQETTWHEHLRPGNLNVVNGKLYIVGMPNTTVELRLYNFPSPSYVGYVYDNKEWRRIPFGDIPEAMYDMNLLEAVPDPNQSGPVTLAYKNKQFADTRIFKPTKRIDPSYKYPNYEFEKNCLYCK